MWRWVGLTQSQSQRNVGTNHQTSTTTNSKMEVGEIIVHSTNPHPGCILYMDLKLGWCTLTLLSAWFVMVNVLF